LVFNRFIVFSIFVAVFMSAPEVYAAERVRFVDKDDFNQASAQSLLSEKAFDAVAAVDLNGDDIDEFILETDHTANSKTYNIWASANSGLISLASIQSQNIMISDERVDGVRSILSFSNTNDDFDYDVYEWDISRTQYVDKKRRNRENRL